MSSRRCVSVVVVTYNSEATITNCIQSVLSTAEGWIESVVVVDNASTDSTLGAVKRFGDTVVLIENRGNNGFSTACNQGARAGMSEYILFLNPDARVGPLAVSSLVKFLDARLNAACCGPLVHEENGLPDPACRRGFPTPLNSIGKLFFLDRVFANSRSIAGYAMPWLGFDRETRVDCVSGACLLIRREDFDKLAGFDESYFLFGEDIDLCKRIDLAGRETWFVPSAQVEHVGGHSMRQEKHTAGREFYRAMRIYMSKHWRNLSGPAYKFVETGVSVRAWMEKFIGH